MKYPLVIGFVLGLAGLAMADEVRLKNGGTLKGTPREESGKVLIDTGLGTVTVAASEVEAILPDSLRCQEYAADPECIALIAAPSAKPEEPKKKAGVQPRDGSPKKKQGPHARPQPESSPGYAYFGIPPSIRPRGSQNHGYGGIVYGLPSPIRGFFVTP